LRATGAARGGAHTRPTKAAVTAIAAPDAAAAVAEAEVDTAGDDAEADGATEGADSTGLPHPGGVDEEQPSQEVPSQEVEDEREESAEHEEETYEERDHGDAPPEGDDAVAETDADSTQSQNLTAEDHLDAGEGVISEQCAPPGEGDAEHSVSETEAEAAPEHEPDEAASRATEPEARLDEVKPRQPAVDDELEDMVNMLQGGASFPSSTNLVLAGEIPDED